MSTDAGAQSSTEVKDYSNLVVRVILGVAIVTLVVWGVLAYPTVSANSAARSQADRAAAALQAAGLTAPSQDVLVRTFGQTGGLMCRDPGAALNRAAANLQLVNGAAQVGVRPVVAARRLVAAEEILIGVYCPDQLAAFRDYRDGLRLAAGA